ncbi:hypothetical protein [Streptomyces sp. SID12488]|uniref:hypothetical protein n=1 Tax=Streptomyces sp. SID12488 TaxID=2706040 RepID=UPI0013D9EAA5|nr:hypothetical protein [Streptomyces sp. SID12488]NEA65374.1 hypothetical protein [Streptomyces sp. SID12488]
MLVTQTRNTGDTSEGFKGSMARKVPREFPGRPIRKDQLELLVEAVEREFPSPSERVFSVTVEDGDHDDPSFESVMKAAGHPAFVNNLTINAQTGDKSFTFEIKNGLIKIKAGGGDRHFPAGFCEEVETILRKSSSWLHRTLPKHTRRIIDWCLLPLEAVMAVAAILMTSLMLSWVAVVSAVCCSVATLLITLVARRRFTTYILLKDDSREPWKRAEKLALTGMLVPIIVALIVNVPTWFKDDGAPVTPKSGSTGQSSESAEATASRATASALSRDTQRSPLTTVRVEPHFGPAGEPFLLTGKGFEPGADVWVELVAGRGTTLSKDKAERRLVRANDEGEIQPEKITVGRGVCCSGGTIRVVVDPEGKVAAVETTYQLK